MPEMGGKRIRFKCKKKTCGNLITVKLPSSTVTGNHTTFIIPKAENNDFQSYMELKQNDGLHQLPLGLGIQVIGRTSSTKYPDISLDTDDKSVSRLHCIIEGIKDATDKVCFIIKDNNSKNHVFLNGIELTSDDELYLEHGDEVRLGLLPLDFHFQSVNNEKS